MAQRWRFFATKDALAKCYDWLVEVPERAKHEEDGCVGGGGVDGGGDVGDADAGCGAVRDVALVVAGACRR